MWYYSRFDQNDDANTACIQLDYTVHYICQTSGLSMMVLLVEIMLTVIWIAASATHNHSHSLLFSVILAMLSP